MDNNTIEAFHIKSMNDGVLKLNTGTMYRWHIPKALRKEPIQQGDIVLVRTAQGKSRVVVMQVFREEFEEAGRSYKRVLKVIERAPKRELVGGVAK
ncbi:DUF5839 family protein (plasmid) [Sutcliffiella horikoshii]|uniref:DUF5839 family protein n=1 Tax=Sutcliffiella horikoshii TaxID=79883 RepID=UPI001CBA9F20|nr:DUF5839 family protein [Sutcliffiella horikoshii]UAL49715.1 DUF5839 family protein [Sutcliffiella horikoshii]